MNKGMTEEDIDFIITDLRVSMSIIAGTIQQMKRKQTIIRIRRTVSAFLQGL